MRQSHTIMLTPVALVGLLLVTGCQPLGSTESPFDLVDKYLEYLSPAEKEAWLNSVKSEGMEATIRKLPLPQSLWYTTCNVYGAKTPKGTMTEAEYVEFVREGASVTRRLRKWASSCNRDPGAGSVMRVGAGGAAPVGGFIPRDPTGGHQRQEDKH